MKRILAVLLVIGMLGGCGSFKQAVCSPTADQVAQAVNFLAQVAVLQPYFSPATVTGSALLAVMPGLTQIKSNFCISDQDNFLVYVAQLISGASTQAKAMGFKGFSNPGVQAQVATKKFEIKYGK